MQQKKQQPHIIDVIFVLALFGAFAFSAVMLIIAGSSIYRNTISNMQSNFETRTASSYISEKLRQGGEIGINHTGDGDVLEIRMKSGDREFATYLYCRNGYLCELYSPVVNELTPGLLAAGQKITELDELSAKETLSDNLIEIGLYHKSGETNRLILSDYRKEP
ncbi:MAG: DUF4860 domain-containing protein [Lachnospiraceae bacterium]|nr:DUF4860 domain-containing protein [Lachnospiraceae bacterium]